MSQQKLSKNSGMSLDKAIANIYAMKAEGGVRFHGDVITESMRVQAVVGSIDYAFLRVGPASLIELLSAGRVVLHTTS